MTTSLSLPWTVSVKVPLVMAIAAAVMAVGTTWVVYRLVDGQQDRELAGLTRSYLDGLSPALADPVLRRDVWGVFEILDQPRMFSAPAIPVEVVVADRNGEVIAASNPPGARSGAPLPARFRNGEGGGSLQTDMVTGTALSTTLLVTGGRYIGSLHVLWDITPLLNDRQALLRTAALWTVLLPTIIGFVGWLVTRRMMRPVGILSRHMEGVENGLVRMVGTELVETASGEFARLYRSYNAMAEAIEARRALAARLASEERLSSVGRLAAGVAHEINNPLGGLFATLHLLRSDSESPAVRARAVGLLDRGLTGIRDVVRALLSIYRPERDLRAISDADFEDLRMLIGPQLGNLQLDWSVDPIASAGAAAGPVRQLALNLLLNAIAAAGENGRVGLTVVVQSLELLITVTNTGPCMPAETAAYLEGRAHAEAPGDGLGLWLVRQIVSELRASVSVEPLGAAGGRIVVTVPITDTQRDAE